MDRYTEHLWYQKPWEGFRKLLRCFLSMATVEERKEALSDAEPDMRAAGMVTPRREWLRDEL